MECNKQTCIYILSLLYTFTIYLYPSFFTRLSLLACLYSLVFTRLSLLVYLYSYLYSYLLVYFHRTPSPVSCQNYSILCSIPLADCTTAAYIVVSVNQSQVEFVGKVHDNPLLSIMTEIDLGKPGDFHVHLRDGEMKQLVTPTVHEGGVSVCFVMPNLVPPITEPKRALEYKASLESIDPRTTYLMSLYLSPEITPSVIADAKSNGITGVKVYPAGVTTNSDHGVTSYEAFYPTFAEMEKQDMVLNLHGECPHGDGIHVLNAEEKFLPMLELLHTKFPKLRIILEHCTSKAAIETVKRCGPTVAATITAHHLFLTVDSWGGNALNFCKPVAKFPEDRSALIEAATSGSSKFFFGSDSAPHPIEAKTRGQGAAAGVFTQSAAIPYLAQVFDKVGKLENLKKFVTDNGKAFYKVSDTDLGPGTVRLVRKQHQVPEFLKNDKLTVVPFMAGDLLDWDVEWIN